MAHQGLVKRNGSSSAGVGGGCGDIGIACSRQIPGRCLLDALSQIRNRGNGKACGIAAVGLDPAELGVTAEILEADTLLAVACFEPACLADLERHHILPNFIIDHASPQPHAAPDEVEGLEICPPEVMRYFVRPRPQALDAFRAQRGLENSRIAADQFARQCAEGVNREFYSTPVEKKALVLSHSQDLLALKIVGFADDAIRYYQAGDLHAHVWIGHHGYPPKLRVGDPAGASPFAGLNNAFFLSGSLANHSSICEYLGQFHIRPEFEADAEISAWLFDLLFHVFRYPLEYALEIFAPTIGYDFARLPSQKKTVYRLLQATHPRATPDGAWLALIGQSDPCSQSSQLIAITDARMLQPQVFAWQAGEGVEVGLVASEKQAIDAVLRSLASEDPRFCGRADRYWSGRGGSVWDGGAFVFSIKPGPDGAKHVTCTDKFGHPASESAPTPIVIGRADVAAADVIPNLAGEPLFEWLVERIPSWTDGDLRQQLENLAGFARYPERRPAVIAALTLLMDRYYPLGGKRRSKLLALYDGCLSRVVEIIREAPCDGYIFYAPGSPLPECTSDRAAVIIDASGFPQAGSGSPSIVLKLLYAAGFKRFLLFNVRGHQFIGCGLGPATQGARIDVYGSPGDYLGSGIDGLEIFVHNSGQDQLGQIMKAGKLVVYGDVGQTFLYCAKGGEAYVLGNAAGRPVNSAVGRPRVIINGFVLDHLATGCMAGDPLQGGGFVILNGVRFDEQGTLTDLETPFPGVNLFSLSSGGAVYIRDPRGILSEAQLNGAEFTPLNDVDWALILPYLLENERLLGVKVDELLKCNGVLLPPEGIYRKIQPLHQ